MSPAKQIIRAAEEGDLQGVRQLLSEDPSLVNATGDHKFTPLHAAAEKNHAAVAEALLDAGANLEAETTWGMTPLAWAANTGNGEVAELLLSRGARLNVWSAAGLGMADRVRSFFAAPGKLKPGSAQKRHVQRLDGEWETLPAPDDCKEAISDGFYVACRNGHTEVARFLLEQGADIEFRGFFGGTALHWAAINGHRDTVTFLLENGASKTVLDEQFNSTPAEWAEEGGQTELAEALQ